MGFLKPSIGLALGGGSARGLAHLGIVKAFNDAGIKINYLAGTSIGAIIASAYAFGASVDGLIEYAAQLNWRSLTGFTWSRGGMASNDEIGRIIERFCGKKNIEDATIPLAIVATEITSGKRVILRKGNLARAVMASCCYPGVFTPINIDDHMLVDGGLIENIPVPTLKMMGADIIAAVDLNAEPNLYQPHSVIDILVNAFEIAIHTNSQIYFKKADVKIRLHLGAFNSTDFSKAKELAAEGYEEGIMAAKKLQHPNRILLHRSLPRLLSKLLRR